MKNSNLSKDEQLPEYVIKTEDGVEDRRVLEIHPDGERTLRDPVTGKVYDVSTGGQKPRGWAWSDKYVAQG